MSTLKLFLSITLSYLIVIPSLATTDQVQNTYGPIKTGEMLWDIATKVRPDPKITRYQAMIALVKANPQAFRISCNLNSLKIGQTLLIPSLTEMQILNTAEAEKEYYRQNNEWKAYRQHKGQPIICPPVVSTNIKGAEIAAPILSAIKTAFGNPTPERNTATPPISATTKEIQNTSANQTALTFLQTIVNSISLWITTQSSWSIIILSTITILILAFLIVWRLHKRTTKKTLSQDHHHDLNNDKPWHFGQEVQMPPATVQTTSLYFSAISEETASATGTQIGETKEKSEDIKEKLAYMRTYLAEGEERAVQRLLKEVVARGTVAQQEEAQQLIEISKKMSTLELRIAKSQQLSVPNTAAVESSSLQEVIHAGQQTSLQQYLPENEGKVFDLIDKIFELLDRELNAQGKLMEAYLNRHKPNFFEAKDYGVLKQSEKVVVEAEDDLEYNPHRPTRSATKPTRYM